MHRPRTSFERKDENPGESDIERCRRGGYHELNEDAEGCVYIQGKN